LRHFALELADLRNKLLQMGGMVESAVHRSVRALVDRDESLARRVLEGEPAINQMEKEVDELCTRLLVLQQPMARDLRFLTSVLKINTDLERMGDLAKNTARRALSLIAVPPLKLNVDIPHISNLVEQMLLKALDAFVQEDAELAQQVLQSDDEVDALRTAAIEDIVSFMQHNPSLVHAGMEFVFIVRNLERIGDHATNMAEDVIFMTKGVDVRHRAHM
jgi:phosphate transport system protein